jgi:broad specificity phosphatase PhoE
MTQRPEPAGSPIQHFFDEALLVRGGPTRLYLIRHAQSQGNTGEDLTTDDPDITDVGHAQAKRIGERFRDQRIDAIYASPLRRTQTTAGYISEATGVSVQTKADLHEVAMGPPERDTNALTAEEERAIIERVTHDGTWDAFPESEGSAVARKRISGVMNEIVDGHAGERIVVVAHAGFIQTYVGIALEIARDYVFYPFNASITSIRAKGDRRVIWRLNDVSHLDGMPAGWGGIS